MLDVEDIEEEELVRRSLWMPKPGGRSARCDCLVV